MIFHTPIPTKAFGVLSNTDPIIASLSKPQLIHLMFYITLDCNDKTKGFKNLYSYINDIYINYTDYINTDYSFPNTNAPIINQKLQDIILSYQCSQHPIYHLYLMICKKYKESYIRGHFENCIVGGTYFHDLKEGNLIRENKIKEYVALTYSKLSFSILDDQQKNLKSPYSYPDILGKILYAQDEYNDNLLLNFNDKWIVSICDNPFVNLSPFLQDSFEKLLENVVNNKEPFWQYCRMWIDNLYKKE